MLQAAMEEKAAPGATGGCKQTESQESSNMLEDPNQEHTGPGMFKTN